MSELCDRNCYSCNQPKTLDCCVNKLNGAIPASMNVINVVSWLRENYHFVTLLPMEELYSYNCGAYVKCGKPLPYAILEKAFGQMRDVNGEPILSEKVKDIIVRKLTHQTFTETYIELSPLPVPYFDRDLKIINMCNGYYNWETKEFTEHDFDYPSQIQVAATYDPDAVCPTIEEIVKDILKPYDITRFYEQLAYNFYRSYIMQNMFVLLGDSGTGKSQLLDMIQNTVGKWNISHVTFQDLGGRNANRFSIIKMYGKLVNLVGDMDSTYIPETGKIKMICSGVDEIGGERKHMQDEFNYINFAKSWCSVNKAPIINEDSDAFYRRALMLQCDNKFEIGGDKAERLSAIKDPQEISGLFNKCIALLPDLLERRRFTHQPTIEETKSLYTRSSNTVEVFLNACVEDEPDALVSKADLFKCYTKYCKKYKLARIDSIIGFGRELVKIGWTRDHKVGNRSYGNKRAYCWLDVNLNENI